MKLESEKEIAEACQVIEFAVGVIDGIEGMSEAEEDALRDAQSKICFEETGNEVELDELSSIGLIVAAAIGLGENIEIEGEVYRISANLILASANEGRLTVTHEEAEPPKKRSHNPWTIPGP